MKITRRYEERCPLWRRFFVYFSMPEALKPVVDVQCTMNSAQNTTNNVQGTVFNARSTMHWTQWSEGKTTLHKNAFIRDVAFFNILLFFFYSNNNIEIKRK